MAKLHVDRKDAFLFLGGALFSLLGAKLLKSKKARTVYVNSLAKGMILKDDVQACALSIKEDAEDIVSEARAKAKKAEPIADAE